MTKIKMGELKIKLGDLPRSSNYTTSCNCLIINNKLSKFEICHIILEHAKIFDDKGRISPTDAKKIREFLNEC